MGSDDQFSIYPKRVALPCFVEIRKEDLHVSLIPISLFGISLHEKFTANASAERISLASARCEDLRRLSASTRSFAVM